MKVYGVRWGPGVSNFSRIGNHLTMFRQDEVQMSVQRNEWNATWDANMEETKLVFSLNRLAIFQLYSTFPSDYR